MYNSNLKNSFEKILYLSHRKYYFFPILKPNGSASTQGAHFALDCKTLRIQPELWMEPRHETGQHINPALFLPPFVALKLRFVNSEMHRTKGSFPASGILGFQDSISQLRFCLQGHKLGYLLLKTLLFQGPEHGWQFGFVLPRSFDLRYLSVATFPCGNSCRENPSGRNVISLSLAGGVAWPK